MLWLGRVTWGLSGGPWSYVIPFQSYVFGELRFCVSWVSFNWEQGVSFVSAVWWFFGFLWLFGGGLVCLFLVCHLLYFVFARPSPSPPFFLYIFYPHFLLLMFFGPQDGKKKFINKGKQGENFLLMYFVLLLPIDTSCTQRLSLFLRFDVALSSNLEVIDLLPVSLPENLEVIDLIPVWLT